MAFVSYVEPWCLTLMCVEMMIWLDRSVRLFLVRFLGWVENSAESPAQA